MPYEAVRKSGDPRRTILAFLHGMYGVAAHARGWMRRRSPTRKPSPHRARSGGTMRFKKMMHHVGERLREPGEDLDRRFSFFADGLIFFVEKTTDFCYYH